MNQRFDEAAGETTPTTKWAIVAALLVLVGLVWFAPHGSAEPLSVPMTEEAAAATRAGVAPAGYRGPGPRFAEPYGGQMTPYEEAQAWAEESAESETPTEAPPTL